MPAAPTARRRRRPAGSGWPPGRPRWSPGWPPPRCGTTTRSPRGCPGGTMPPWSPLVNMTSPLCSGVWGGTRSAVIELPGPWPSTIPLYWFPGPKVTPTLDWPSVTSRTTEVWWKDWITWPTSPPAPTTGIADVDAVGPALVQRDGRGEVRRVLVLGLRGDGRQRLQEREVLQRRQLTQLVRLEALLALRGPQLSDRPLQLLVLRLQRPVVERAGKEAPDRADDVEHPLTQRRVDVVGHRLDPRRQAVGPPVEVEGDQRQRRHDQDDDRQRAARPPGPGHPGTTGRSISEWRW